MTEIYFLIGIAFLCMVALGVMEFMTNTYFVSILRAKYKELDEVNRQIALKSEPIQLLMLYDQQGLLKEEIEDIIKEMIS